MNHLQRLGNRISIPINPDKEGFLGRECPNPDCEGYFKIVPGTGLKGKNLPCRCPYCGHTASHDHFWTKEQIEYAESVAWRKISHALNKDLKKLEFERKPKGPFGIGVTMKFKPGRPTPIHCYREKQLETEVVCSNCGLRYSVYGVFAFCPDCGQHNSLQILTKNLDVVEKMLDLTIASEKSLAEKLIENALEDCISAFDGFGRELCRVHASRATDPVKAMKLSFQNLLKARETIQKLFGFDLTSVLEQPEWDTALRGLQKRHLLAHRMGVVDEDYVRKTGDINATVGRKLIISIDEVRKMVGILAKLARNLSDAFLGQP